MALPPEFLPKAIAAMEALAQNGFRYPFPQYGIQQDVRAGMARSYPERAKRELTEAAPQRRVGGSVPRPGAAPGTLGAHLRAGSAASVAADAGEADGLRSAGAACRARCCWQAARSC